MRKGMNNKRFGSRFIAFFVTLAMVLSLCTPFAFAADVSNGSVRFRNNSNNFEISEIDTGVRFDIYATLTYSSSAGEKANLKMYFEIDDIKKIAFEEKDQNNETFDQVGDFFVRNNYTYTLRQDDKGYYYIEISGTVGGAIQQHVISAKFVNGTALDGDKLKITLYEDDEEVQTPNTDSESSRIITARAELEWANLKTVDATNIVLNQSAETLSDNTKDITKVTYTITETAAANIVEGKYVAPGTTVLKNGEAVLQNYTASDTFTLPTGMYIDATESSPEAAVKAAFDFSSLQNYTIKDIVCSDNKVTGFKVTWTETNSSTTVAMEPKIYNVTLDTSLVKIDNNNYNNGTISNSVVTEYNYASANGSSETKKTLESSASTFVTVDGNAMGGVTKSIVSVDGDKAADYINYDGTVSGYVVEGDTITYKVTVTNGSDNERTYKVTDFLSDANLTFVSATFNGDNLDVKGINEGISFDVTVKGESSADILITAKVGATETNTTITNKVKVEIDSDVTEQNAPAINHQPTAPEVSIVKDSTIDYFNDGSVFNYTITVSNSGTAVAEDIKIEDNLPEGITLADDISCAFGEVGWQNGEAENSNGTVKASGKNISGTVTLGINERVTITVPVKVENAENLNLITNSASETFNGETKTASSTITRNSASVEGLQISKTTSTTVADSGETIEYKITVINPNGKGDFATGNLEIKDILPEALEYVVGSVKWQETWSGYSDSITDNGSSTAPVFTLTNVRIPNDGRYEFTIKCTVKPGMDVNNNFDNTVTIINPDGKDGATDTNTTVSGGGTAQDSKIRIEKKAYVDDRDVNGGEVAPGETITYYLTITNRGTEDLTAFDIEDTLEGNYDTSVPITLEIAEMDDGVVHLTNAWAPSGTVYQKGDNPFNNGSITLGGNKVFNINYAQPQAIGVIGNTFYGSGLTIPKGKSITFSYTLKTAATFAGGSNEAIMTSGDETSSSKVTYEAAAAGPGGEQPVTPTTQLSITKTVADKVLTDSNFENARNKYTVTIANNSETDYVSSGATFTDYIPAGWALSIDSNAEQTQHNWNLSGDQNPIRISGKLKTVNEHGITVMSDIIYATEDCGNKYNGITVLPVEVYVKNKNGTIEISNIAYNTLKTNSPDAWVTEAWGTWFEPSLADYKVDCSTIEVKFPGTVTIPAGQTLTFSYYLVPTDEEIESVKTALDKDEFEDRNYKNEASFEGTTAFLNEDGATVNKIIDVETVTLTQPKIHPGISKEYTGHFANAESEEMGDSTSGVKVGEYLVWTVKVYNGAATGGLDMEDYTVTETYPTGYSFKEGSLKAYTPSIKKFDANGNEVSEGLEYVNPTDGVFDFSGDAYKLAPGEHLEFTVLTEGENGLNNGLYTNEVLLKLNETIYDSAIVAGTKKNDGISASVTLPLYSISTTANKTVTSADGLRSASSSSDALENRIKVSMGDIIRYKLEVKNNDSTNILQDFAVIDRLPYAEDRGVISTDDRGSKFAVKYEGNPKAVITIPGADKDEIIELDEKYLDIQFASDAYSSFVSTDLDWVNNTTLRAGVTRVPWLSEKSQSTNLVKFALKNLDQLNDDRFAQSVDVDGVVYTKYGVPANAKISIEFDAKVPEYVQNVGEGNIAWNSFGYYFNSDAEENLIAEPAKVGVWVEDENYGGSILVRKIYKTNLPSKVRKFYFALYKDKYDPDENSVPLQIMNLEMTGSVEGAQATGYFTNIDFDRNKSNAYYIYESDAAGKPLEAVGDGLTWDTYTAAKPKDGEENSPEETRSNPVVTAKTAIGVDGAPLTMDNTSQIKSAQDKPNWKQYAGEAEHYNSSYLVWHKDLSASKTTNSAIFTNSYFATVDYEMMGPFYADVPTNKNSNNAYSNMTSTRPESFQKGEINTTVSSDERDTMADYAANDSIYSIEKAGTAYGEKYEHTIATGFLAKIKGVGDYTIEQAKWTVTTSNPNRDDTPGVFVRLRVKEDQETDVQLMYLDEFEVFEEESEGKVELGSVGGFEDISDDENFLSDYTVEERAAMVAEGLGIDPANIQYDDYGVPYVIMDEELQNEAFALSEVSEATGTRESDIQTGGNTLEQATFGDAVTTDGYYVIYKLNGTHQYVMEFNDNIPHITMAEGAEAYIGLVIDQLYDQKANATIEFSDEPLFDDDMLVAAGKANMAYYTNVESPRQKGNFSLNLLYKLTAGTPVGFDDLLADGATATYDTTIQNAAGTARIAATSAKTVSVNATSHQYYKWDENGVVKQTESEKYSSYLALGGTGTKDYRSLIVNVPAGSTLRVIARSSGSSERTLKVEKPDGTIDELTVPASNAAGDTAIATLSAQQVYVKEGGAVYLYSKNSGINIFSIEIVKGDTTGSVLTY